MCLFIFRFFKKKDTKTCLQEVAPEDAVGIRKLLSDAAVQRQQDDNVDVEEV